ncbi:MAG TPA: alpha-hydroxy-acid oxidizing protein [Candidatus Limnocylindrales bacterium]|nr:alpha-hydroxy-acid oxidizing protein [Candidatus Limnocylindrales bacterium]
MCGFCGSFAFDEEKGDSRAELPPGIKLEDIPETWRCPVCGHWKGDLKEISDQEYAQTRAKYEKNYPATSEKPLKDIDYYRDIARKQLARTCAVNKVCDGDPDRLCQSIKYNRPVGFGGAGQGKTWSANFQALSRYKLKMRVIKEHFEPKFETVFLGNKIALPVLATSISGTLMSMNNALSEEEFQRGLVEGAKKAGTIGLSGNTVDAPDHPGIDIIGGIGGWGIPVFKPQSQERLLTLFNRCEQANVLAIGVDLDGYGSTNWALRGKPLYRKSEHDLKELVDATEKPVIYKGIMNIEDAGKVVDSGAKALDVSNHGGRVMDCGRGVAEVLPEIVDTFKGKITIMADGAVRTGFDVLKLLAIGADVALIGRPLAWMSLAGGAEAVAMYLNQVRNDLRMAMVMTCCDSLEEVSRDILFINEQDRN